MFRGQCYGFDRYPYVSYSVFYEMYGYAVVFVSRMATGKPIVYLISHVTVYIILTVM